MRDVHGHGGLWTCLGAAEAMDSHRPELKDQKSVYRDFRDMNKRGFLRSLLGSLAGVAVADRASASPSASQRLLQISPLTGFQFHADEALWVDFQVGAGLELQREPQNPYDRRAVAILWNGQKLGYILRNENAAIAQLLDRGERLSWLGQSRWLADSNRVSLESNGKIHTSYSESR